MVLQKKLLVVSVILLSLFQTGCVRLILPTSESELINRARVFTTEIDLDVVSSYANLKKYMEKCVEYHNENGYQVINSKLDRDDKIASLVGKSNYGTYTFKVVLEGLENERTKMTYFSPKKKIGFSEFRPEKTLMKLEKFALYDGKATCRTPK